MICLGWIIAYGPVNNLVLILTLETDSLTIVTLKLISLIQC